MVWPNNSGNSSDKVMKQPEGSQNIFFAACKLFYALIKPKKVNLKYFSIFLDKSVKQGEPALHSG
jgi:hypothetical protein